MISPMRRSRDWCSTFFLFDDQAPADVHFTRIGPKRKAVQWLSIPAAPRPPFCAGGWRFARPPGCRRPALCSFLAHGSASRSFTSFSSRCSSSCSAFSSSPWCSAGSGAAGSVPRPRLRTWRISWTGKLMRSSRQRSLSGYGETSRAIFSSPAPSPQISSGILSPPGSFSRA